MNNKQNDTIMNFKKKYAGTYVFEDENIIATIHKNEFDSNEWSGTIEKKLGYKLVGVGGAECEATEVVFECEWEKKKFVKESIVYFLNNDN
tara:strand:- start:177 stop:449 length:273 start_codon:yes stop_codon:yes gene_type:complete